MKTEQEKQKIFRKPMRMKINTTREERSQFQFPPSFCFFCSSALDLIPPLLLLQNGLSSFLTVVSPLSEPLSGTRAVIVLDQ